MEKETAIDNIEETAIENWHRSRHQEGKRDTAQVISNKSVIQLKTSAMEAWNSSRHQQRKPETAQDIGNKIQLKTLAIEAWYSSKHQQGLVPFINTSCFFRDFPAFFVGERLSVWGKNAYFSPSCAQFPLHTNNSRFWWFSSLFRGGPPISFSQKPFLFPFMCTNSVS